MDFACSGFAFNADCQGTVYVQLYSTKDNRFSVYVDGVLQPDRIQVTSANSGQYFAVAKNLTKGAHEIRIVNQTQFIWSHASAGGVMVDGEFLAKPEPSEIFLEFYGDSILNGSNVYNTGGGVNSTDATSAFGYQTALALGAEMNLVGCSSIGLTKNSRSFVMKDIWNKAGAKYSVYSADASGYLVDGIPDYDFARIPSAVIMEQGVNDGSNASTQAFADAVEEMINNLRSKYGADVPIVWLVGYSGGVYNDYIPTILENLGGEAANLYVCELTNVAADDGVHPDLETTPTMVAELSAYLRDLLNIQ